LANNQSQFDFSLGEPIVADISGTNFICNIGFQQPYYDLFTSVIPSEAIGYQPFPNPFSGALHFKASTEIERYFLLDAKAGEVFHSQTSGKDFEYKVSNLPMGFYQLRVLMNNGKTIGSKVVSDSLL